MKEQAFREVQAKVDEFGDLAAARAVFAPTEARYQKLREEFKGWFADEPAKEFVINGDRFSLRVSPCSTENKPDVPAVRKRLGAATFLLVAQVTKKALEGWLLKPEIEELCISTQTGSRSYSPTPLPAKATGATLG